MEKRGQLIRFKEKVDVNIEFYSRLKDVCHELKLKYSEAENEMHEDIESFQEMLLITLSNDDALYQHSKDISARMQQYKEKEGFTLWDFKLQMMILELGTFNEIYRDLQMIEELYDRRVKLLSQRSQELQHLSGQNQAVDQTLPKRITNVQGEIDIHSNTSRAAYGVMGLLVHKIINVDIELIKHRKKERFQEIVKMYASKKLEHLKAEAEFWNNLNNHEGGRMTNLDTVILGSFNKTLPVQPKKPNPKDLKEAKD